MGSDFLLFSMRAPHYEPELAQALAGKLRTHFEVAILGELGKRRIDRIVPTLEQAALDFIADGLQLDEPEGDYATDDDAAAGWRTFLIQEITATARLVLESVLDSDNEDTAWPVFNGQQFILTGGPSWGDAPNDTAGKIDLLDEVGVFDEAITEDEVAAL